MAHNMNMMERGPTAPPAGTRALTIAVLDPVPIFREGLNALVNRTPGLRWVGHAANHHTSLRLCEQFRPNIILIDSGFDPQCHLIRLLSDGDPTLVVVVLVRDAQRTGRYLATAVAAGAHGMVPRNADPRRLAEAIRRAHVERRYLDPSLAPLTARQKRHAGTNGQVLSTPQRPQMPLSRREYQVLQLLAEGLENSAIAKILYLSVETVRTHVKSILRKLSARDRTHAVATAFRSGILIAKPDDGPAAPPEETPPAVALPARQA